MPRAMTKLESEFSQDVDEELDRRFPGCVILKMDPLTTHQGIPDKLVLWRRCWALLETKRGMKSARQPNQEYYVDLYDEMSFSAFINPDNMHEVMDGLQQAFGAG